MAKCPRCEWSGDFVEVTGTVESQCPNCGFQGNLDAPTYEDMSKDELTAICEERNILVPPKATKQDMIDLLAGP